MKLSMILCLISILSISAKESYAQKMMLSIEVQDRTLEEVFDIIKTKSEYSFWFRKEEVNLKEKVSLHVKNEHINKILDKVLAKQNLTYTINDKHIVIFKQTNLSLQQRQARKISGVVFDNNKEPIPGANVVVKGATNGTITDIDGFFTLNVDKGTTLLISFIGYNTQEVAITGKTVLNIILQSEVIALDEVVAIGYGSVKKSDLTGAVANVTADKSNIGGSSTSVSQLIQGRIAGVNSSQFSSQPGGGGSTIIRGRNSIYGSSSPLYVVDGFPYDASGSPDSGESFGNVGRDPLNFINPNDIETISILKDASATAIYGTRGANGVILITTKRGKMGKLKVTYDGYAGTQNQAKKYEMLSGPEYMEYWSQFTEGPSFTPEEIKNASTTNWMDQVTQQGFLQSHQISFSAAEKYLRYYFSAGYYGQTGIIKNAEMERISVRSNLEYQKDKVKISTNIAFTNIKDQNQADNGGTRNSIIEGALSFAPNLSVSKDGSYVVDEGSAFNIYPLSVMNVQDKTRSDKVDINANLEYELLPGLKPQLKLAYNSQNALRTYFLPSTTPYNGGYPNAEGRFHSGRATATNPRNTGFSIEGLLNYTKTFENNLKLIGLMGYTYQTQNWFGNRTKGIGFSPVDVFDSNNMGAADEQYTQTWKGENVVISGFGRVDLIWKDKYFVTGTLRRDGASKFGVTNKWGWFPGASAAWKLNNENFMKGYENLDLLKLRIGYGVTGNSGFDNYLCQSLYNVNKEDGAVIGQDIHAATMLSTVLANPNLKWETTAQFNVGIDFSFLQRFSGSFDVYSKKTSDLIIPLPLPMESGQERQWINAADFKVLGIEYSMDCRFIETKNLNWTTTFAFGWDDNELSNINVLGESVRSSLQSIGMIDGEKPGSFYMYKFKEIDKDGALTFYDLNEDGVVDVKDRTVVGNPDPNITLGLGNSLRYRNFDLDFFFNAALGQEIFNANKVEHTSAYLAQPKNLYKCVLTEANLPKLYSQAVGGDFTNNSRWVENGSYLRLQNVTLGYNFPASLFRNKINKLRLFVQAQNLFTVSNYSGVNPESNSVYPSVRTITGGLSLTL